VSSNEERFVLAPVTLKQLIAWLCLDGCLCNIARMESRLMEYPQYQPNQQRN